MKKRRHLTYICQTFGLGGAEVFACDLLSALSDTLDIESSVWTTYPPFLNMLADAQIFARRLPIEIDIIGNWKGLVKASIFWPLAAVQYALLLFSLRTDVVLLSGFFEKLIVTPLACFRGTRVIWIEYAPLTSLERKFFGIPLWCYLRVAPLAERIIVPTAHTARWFDKQPALRAAVLMIPCGRYQFMPQLSRPSVMSADQSSSHTPTIVCVSRIEKEKGQELLVHAAKLLQKKHPNLRIHLIGEGSYKEEVQRMIRTLHIEDMVHCLGRVDDVRAEVLRAEVCVFPSVWELEGFGLVTIEAMACAKPIVAFAIGPTPEILTHNHTGLLVPAGDVKQLAGAIDSLLQDKALARRLGQEARQVYLRQYRLEKTVDEYGRALFADSIVATTEK